MEAIKRLKALLKEIYIINSSVSLMHWDQSTYIPSKGAETRAEALGYLSTLAFKKLTSPEMGELLETLSSQNLLNSLSNIDTALLRVVKRDYEKAKAIPPELYEKFVIASSRGQNAWEKAKREDDFGYFRPYLEEIIKLLREMVEFYGYEKDPYDALLDNFEPGMTTERLQHIIAELKPEIINFVRTLSKLPAIDTSFLNGRFARHLQSRLSKMALKVIGYDFDAGRLDETVHPFTITIGPGDVRVTTGYKPSDFTASLYGTIHEGGHALYEQGISPELKWTPLADGASMGIHESQSRLMENIIGKSYEFLSFFYPKIQKAFPKVLENVSLDMFYKAVNKVEPSLIRIEADEVTYNLHIMLRFELEKALINKELEVKDLPEAWNEKMKEFLGIVPPNDTMGVLQDVHWGSGMIGYFPSYMLGNLYAAQFFNTAVSEIPDLHQQIAAGEISNLLQWLREKIHKHGRVYEPDELCKRVTGEELSPRYFIDYIKSKFGKIYGL
ncbi:peptidase M32 [Kosmotoga arenicorallina S304]|uniref:Metal-dependent carboxypeptidase n=1 Tax=Kosmotoga arenicorallina S304 TaxID=1453497 RepID=A0A176K0D9_9BACT|nr:carboxypeptidase M32 [Kosmotoga arenicorallina]OAA29743.1 peptidase M32 [Kosmotoga arenicorallina S304]